MIDIGVHAKKDEEISSSAQVIENYFITARLQIGDMRITFYLEDGDITADSLCQQLRVLCDQLVEAKRDFVK